MPVISCVGHETITIKITPLFVMVILKVRPALHARDEFITS